TIIEGGADGLAAHIRQLMIERGQMVPGELDDAVLLLHAAEIARDKKRARKDQPLAPRHRAMQVAARELVVEFLDESDKLPEPLLRVAHEIAPLFNEALDERLETIDTILSLLNSGFTRRFPAAPDS